MRSSILSLALYGASVIQAQQASREALQDHERLCSKQVDTHDAASLDSLIERIRQYLPGL